MVHSKSRKKSIEPVEWCKIRRKINLIEPVDGAKSGEKSIELVE